MDYGPSFKTREKKGHPESAESGTFWISTLLDTDSRMRTACGIGKDETEASLRVFQTLQQRGHTDGPPPIIIDGWGVLMMPSWQFMGWFLNILVVVVHPLARNQVKIGVICKWSNSAMNEVVCKKSNLGLCGGLWMNYLKCLARAPLPLNEVT